MKSVYIGTLIYVFLSTTIGFGQNPQLSVKDSISTFYDQFFEKLETNYIFTKDVNWSELKPLIKKEALQQNSFKNSLKICSTLFDTINGSHLILFAGEDMYQGSPKRQFTQEDFSPSFLQKYEENSGFEVKLLDHNYGYIFVPGMLLLNATQEELDANTQKIYDAIAELDEVHEIKGWIVDLRLNIGGNSNTMLAGLYHLIGDHTTGLYLDANKNVDSRSGLFKGKFYENHKVLTQAKVSLEPTPKIPVALLTGIMTNSAGEFVVLGFRGRNNTIIIGEESYGSTTANDLFELPFDTKAAITLSFGTDRTGNYTPTIVPNISIIKEANFKDLEKDRNVLEAIKFINSKYN